MRQQQLAEDLLVFTVWGSAADSWLPCGSFGGGLHLHSGRVSKGRAGCPCPLFKHLLGYAYIRSARPFILVAGLPSGLIKIHLGTHVVP